MSEEDAPFEVEASGETVGEAKWLALRQLESLHPGLDRDLVGFEVLSEGERGLLGVGTSPARVIARIDPAASEIGTPAGDESDLARVVREVLTRVTDALGARCRIDINEDDESMTALLSGGNVGLLIGRRGRTIDALQYVVSSIAWRVQDEPRKSVIVDASGYRERREERLRDVAEQGAERVASTGEPVALEPMTSIERKLVHLSLKEHPGVETRSEGEEPSRYVVIAPAGES
jgi:spoIIIJ-associated protein